MKRIAKFIIAGTVLLVTLFVGVAIGGAGESTTTHPSPWTSVPTVKVPGPTVTRTVEADHEHAPQACLDAIDYAEQGFDISARGFGFASQALQGAANLDVAAIERANEGMTDLKPEMDRLPPLFNKAKAECRASQ